MALLPILEFPDPRLRTKAVPVDAARLAEPSFQQLFDDMFETMYDAPGIGLAASQVDVHQRFMVIDVTEDKSRPLVFINPVIEHLTPETHVRDEGCLSFPGIFVPVKRSLGTRVRALDLDGNEFVVEANDLDPVTGKAERLFARALQHEHDHLINRLLVDHVGPVKRQLIKRKLERMTDEEAHRLIMEHGD